MAVAFKAGHHTMSGGLMDGVRINVLPIPGSDKPRLCFALKDGSPSPVDHIYDWDEEVGLFRYTATEEQVIWQGRLKAKAGVGL